MDDLTLDDFDSYVVDVAEVKLLGKRAYVRKLTFDGQLQVYEMFADRADEDSSYDDIRRLIPLVLCNKNGDLLFQDVDAGYKALAKAPAEELMEVVLTVRALNGMDHEEEVKN